jgi:acetyltransferase-like isoleucine patch superfamily enzyme
MRITSVLVQIAAAAFPHRIKHWFLRRALGWQIGYGVRIGFSLILADRVWLGSNTVIGHFNTFRKLRLLEIGSDTQIGNFNDFMAGPHTGWPASLRIGDHAHLTSHHYLDCSGGIHIGAWSLIGGRDAQFWTHFYHAGTIHRRRLSIGERCYICARATLVYCHLPDDCIVAAGAVVNGDFRDAGPGLLLTGNPARIKRKR